MPQEHQTNGRAASADKPDPKKPPKEENSDVERITLASPFQPDPRQATQFEVARVDLNWRAKSIVIEVSGGSVDRVFHYDGDAAVALMVTLNKANLGSKSLHKRILERLVADGLLAGTIEGTVD